MQVQPYLFFDGRCEEALAFYGRVLGAEVEMLMRYRESPEAPPPGMVPVGFEDKVMHAGVRIGDSHVMAADDCTRMQGSFQGFQLTLSVTGETEAEERFAALAEGGQVKVPLARTFFAARFGMLVDRFGVSWMVIASVS